MRNAERARCAARLSFWWPGLGQFYRRRWLRGALFLASSWWLGNAALAAWPPAAMWSCARPPAPVCWAITAACVLAVWIAAIRDAGR